MPKGVYQRKPWMKSTGAGFAARAEIPAMRQGGMSITQVARALGVSRPTVVKWSKVQGRKETQSGKS